MTLGLSIPPNKARCSWVSSVEFEEGEPEDRAPVGAAGMALIEVIPNVSAHMSTIVWRPLGMAIDIRIL